MAQSLIFEEYDLPNGLHVILHPNNAAPVVTIGVMYHVGAKDEDPTRTGFAHFFEHLLLLLVANGLILYQQMAGITMPLQHKTKRIITKFFPLTTCN